MAQIKTIVLKAEGMNATGLPVPAVVVEKLGAGKRPKVTVTLKGYTYRSTVAVYGGEFILPLAAVHRQAAGVKAGQPVQVTVELDMAPREVELPKDLAAALKKAGVRAPSTPSRSHIARNTCVPSRRHERPRRARAESTRPSRWSRPDRG